MKGQDKQTVQRIVEEVLNGRTGVIEASRRLLTVLHRSPELASEEDFNLIRAIESETDDLSRWAQFENIGTRGSLSAKSARLQGASCSGVISSMQHVGGHGENAPGSLACGCLLGCSEWMTAHHSIRK